MTAEKVAWWDASVAYGILPSELRFRWSSTDFTEWQAYQELKSAVATRDQNYLAQIALELRRVWEKLHSPEERRQHPDVFAAKKLSDFLLEFGTENRREPTEEEKNALRQTKIEASKAAKRALSAPPTAPTKPPKHRQPPPPHNRRRRQ